MHRRLTDHLSSSYVRAASAIREGRRGRLRVVAYVESYDDIFFWRSLLRQVETPAVAFEVMLPSRTDLSRGKKQAIANELGPRLGECMIACVDADYDYLMQGATAVSEAILRSPYIFHTYAYAIENLQCYAPSLRDICVMATLNDRPAFDFEAYLAAYSACVYELLVWTVWLYRHQRYHDLPLNKFLNIISLTDLNIFNPAPALERLRREANRRVAYMQRTYPEAKPGFHALKDELARLGLRADNAYLYVQGHHLMDNIVLLALNPVCTLLRREREKEIKRLAHGRQIQMDNELAAYQHAQCPVEQMIRRNTAFTDAEPCRHILDDLRAFVSRVTAQQQERRQEQARPENGGADTEAARRGGDFT